MSAFSTLHPLIRPYVQGCSIPMIDQHIARVTRDFCTFTRAWKIDCQGFPLSAGVQFYQLSIPESSELVQVEHMNFGQNTLSPRTRIQIQHDFPEWCTETASVPCFYITHSQCEVELWPIPSPEIKTEKLQAEVSLRPALTATAIPDHNLLEEFGEAIVDGTLANLLQIPKREWSDFGLSQAYRASYTDKRNDAKVRSRDMRSQAPRTVKYGGL